MTRRVVIFALGGAMKATTLGEETVARALEGVAPKATYLLLDAASNRVICSRWPDASRSCPAGSLVKPFTALAYGETHANRYPRLVCTRCWKPDGHGVIGLPEALAFSCNSYFLALARDSSAKAVAQTASAFGLPRPVQDRPEAWIGLGGDWMIPPLTLAGAYCELSRRGSQEGPKQVLTGLRLSARIGTSRAIGRDALAKTGTAVCHHIPKGSGDGFSIAFVPAEAPQFALLVSTHDAPGAHAARVAGEMLKLIDPLSARPR